MILVPAICGIVTRAVHMCHSGSFASQLKQQYGTSRVSLVLVFIVGDITVGFKTVFLNGRADRQRKYCPIRSITIHFTDDIIEIFMVICPVVADTANRWPCLDIQYFFGRLDDSFERNA